MRLFLFLAAALVAIFNANSVSRSKFTLPGGLPNGSIITFYFWHVPNANVDDTREPVGIDFYDQPTADIDEDPDKAHLRFDLTGKYKVISDTYINHQFRKQGAFWTTGGSPPSRGWWRIDMYKHDSNTLSVFFQGFAASVSFCTFEKSLDNVKSIYISSEFVDYNRTEMRLNTPNGKIPPFSVAGMKEFVPRQRERPHRTLITFPYFPVGTHIEMTTLGYPIYDDDTPMLLFEGSSFTFMTLFHIMYGEIGAVSSEIWITNNEVSGKSILKDESYKKDGTVCAWKEMEGGLQHLYLKRITLNKLELRVFYKSSGAEGITCTHTITNRYINQLDRPFTIKSHNGAAILHLDHSIPRMSRSRRAFMK